MFVLAHSTVHFAHSSVHFAHSTGQCWPQYRAVVATVQGSVGHSTGQCWPQCGAGRQQPDYHSAHTTTGHSFLLMGHGHGHSQPGGFPTDPLVWRHLVCHHLDSVSSLSVSSLRQCVIT